MKQSRRRKIDWLQFLSGVPASDYIFQDIPYEEQIEQASALIKEAEIILIGAGAGTSTAAGLVYSGERFTDNFGEFIKKYGSMYMTDMYAAGFYPFPTQEAKWGYWSKHSMINRFLPPALPLYNQLYEIVKDKDYFVLTTNVDHQFQKAGFQSDRIFATQGDYGNIQCEKGFPFEKMVRENRNLSLIRLNMNEAVVPESFGNRAVGIGGDMAKVISDLNNRSSI